MKISNKFGMPEALVRAITNDPYHYTGNISVTQLIKSPRQRWLEIRHNDVLEVDAVDRLWVLMGSAVHAILERADTMANDEILEARVKKDFGEYSVSGQPDLWTAPNKLSDYKLTSVWAVIGEVKPDWEKQLNMLAHLYRSIGLPVEEAEIVAILRDWSKTKALTGGKSYPKVGAKIVKVPLWPDEEVERFMQERLTLHMEHENTPDNELPFCTAEERWQSPTRWAVMKNKNKRATKVFDVEDEASLFAANMHEACEGKHNYRVEERLGVDKRCKDYCPAKDFCNQYLQNIGHEEALES